MSLFSHAKTALISLPKNIIPLRLTNASLAYYILENTTNAWPFIFSFFFNQTCSTSPYWEHSIVRLILISFYITFSTESLLQIAQVKCLIPHTFHYKNIYVIILCFCSLFSYLHWSKWCLGIFPCIWSQWVSPCTFRHLVGYNTRQLQCLSFICSFLPLFVILVHIVQKDHRFPLPIFSMEGFWPTVFFCLFNQ